MTVLPEKTILSRICKNTEIRDEDAQNLISQALTDAWSVVSAASGASPRVLLLPPDITRFHSRAGLLTCAAYKALTELGVSVSVMPALGTHVPMTAEEIRRMYPNIPPEKFIVHNWRNDVIELGRIEKEWVEKTTDGAVSYDWPVQVNKLLPNGGFSMIVSIGQVVPHEVAGLANHAKNIFVGCGGKEGIDKSHFAGAAYGMERIMGKADTPVRLMLDEGIKRFGNALPPVLYALTVIGTSSAGSTALKGIFAGFGRDCFEKAAELTRELNVNFLEKPIKKAVVYLEAEEYRTTWLGNKAVYRTRMAMADDGELLIIAPGLERFGEDRNIDSLIRKYGYRPSAVIRQLAEKETELKENLSAAAHLIHGSSEDRFTIRYCPGHGLSRAEIESVGYRWGNINEALSRYEIKNLKTGWNTHADGEEFFYINNPALGLWALR